MRATTVGLVGGDVRGWPVATLAGSAGYRRSSSRSAISPRR